MAVMLGVVVGGGQEVHGRQAEREAPRDPGGAAATTAVRASVCALGQVPCVLLARTGVWADLLVPLQWEMKRDHPLAVGRGRTQWRPLQPAGQRARARPAMAVGEASGCTLCTCLARVPRSLRRRGRA